MQWMADRKNICFSNQINIVCSRFVDSITVHHQITIFLIYFPFFLSTISIVKTQSRTNRHKHTCTKRIRTHIHIRIPIAAAAASFGWLKQTYMLRIVKNRCFLRCWLLLLLLLAFSSHIVFAACVWVCVWKQSVSDAWYTLGIQHSMYVCACAISSTKNKNGDSNSNSASVAAQPFELTLWCAYVLVFVFVYTCIWQLCFELLCSKSYAHAHKHDLWRDRDSDRDKATHANSHTRTQTNVTNPIWIHLETVCSPSNHVCCRSHILFLLLSFNKTPQNHQRNCMNSFRSLLFDSLFMSI